MSSVPLGDKAAILADGSRLKERFANYPFSLSSFDLNVGKHLVAYKGFVEAQNCLAKDSLDIETLARAFRKLPHISDIWIDPHNAVIGASEILGSLGSLEGSEVTLDGQHTLPAFILALEEAQLRPLVFILGSKHPKWGLEDDEENQAKFSQTTIEVIQEQAHLAPSALEKAFPR